MATSSAEEEYISAWEATCEIVWLRRVLQDLGIPLVEATSLFMDKIKLDNILVNFLDPLLVIQKEYEYTTFNIKVIVP